jgi:hypothetical protein
MCQLFQACRLCFNMTGIRFSDADVQKIRQLRRNAC